MMLAKTEIRPRPTEADVQRMKAMSTKQRVEFEAELMTQELLENSRMTGVDQISRVLLRDLSRKAFLRLLTENANLKRKRTEYRRHLRRLQKLWDTFLSAESLVGGLESNKVEERAGRDGHGNSSPGNS